MPLLCNLYILNKAEQNILGLAWFFVRYLVHGRFHYSCLVMDDPAQEMDQTTYRDLCRLWGSLLRLHKVNKIPLILLILLHNDERALDAMRATDGLLHLLGWNSGNQASVLKSMKLLGEEFNSPLPTDALFL